MLEYEINEAEDVLIKNLDAAKKSLGQVEDDLLYIRDQMTTLEVSILSQNKKQYLSLSLLIFLCHSSIYR